MNSEDTPQEIPTPAKVCSPGLFCDNCCFYPIEPVHGHYMCPQCHMPTKCCEGAPADE